MLEILFPATSGDLTTLAIAKRELGVADAAQDTRITDMIHEASDLVTQWCNRSSFGRETLRQTERLASPVDVIVLQRDLGVLVSSVTEDGVALAAADYEQGGVLLYRLRGGVRVAWTARTVIVEYQAGFVLPDETPSALGAALHLCRCAERLRAQRRGNAAPALRAAGDRDRALGAKGAGLPRY
jgi:hypothetical protein